MELLTDILTPSQIDAIVTLYNDTAEVFNSITEFVIEKLNSSIVTEDIDI